MPGRSGLRKLATKFFLDQDLVVIVLLLVLVGTAYFKMPKVPSFQI